MLRAGALFASLMTATAFAVAGAPAQTLTNPNPRPAPSAPVPAKPHAREDARACSAYGAGFARLPGSDACVKIGGWVTIEATGTGH